MEQDRRRTPRYPFEASIEMHEGSSPDMRTARVTGLSLNGCYVSTESPYPEGASLTVKVFTATEFYEGQATVIYTFPCPFHKIPRHSRVGLFAQEKSLRDSRSGKDNLLWCAELCVCGTRLGVLGRPVFGREGHVPEIRAGRCEFHADFRPAAAHRAQKRYAALLFLFRLVVPHVHHTAADNARVEEHERTVRVDRERFRYLLKILPLGILAANADAHLHEHALAAAAGSGMCVWCGNLRHANPRFETTIPLKKSFERASRTAVFQVDTSAD